MGSTRENPIILGENLSLNLLPHLKPNARSPTILVLGGGVTGLISTCVLLDRGYHVKVIAKRWASFTDEQRLTSQIAGALWEYPPARTQQLKMQEIENSGVRGFNHAPDLIRKQDVDPHYGAVDAYEHLAPVIDTDRAMEWLMLLVQSKGAKFTTATIHGDLFDQEDGLRAEFGADVIINATGLAATELAGDPTCFPLRGALIRVINDGTDFPKIESSLAIAADAARDNEIVFIVPRNDNILLLGDIAQPHESTLDLTLQITAIQRMRSRCEDFLPGLRSARLDPDYPLAQGLRPAQERNGRVERELRRRRVSANGEERLEPSRIVHSYGQGGARWSLAFGCAADVAGLVEDALDDLPAQAMAGSDRREVEDEHVQAQLHQPLKKLSFVKARL